MSPKAATSPAMILEVTCKRPIIMSRNGSKLRLSRPVYEFPLNGQWIMMDIDDGYILWTGIWKGELRIC